MQGEAEAKVLQLRAAAFEKFGQAAIMNDIVQKVRPTTTKYTNKQSALCTYYLPLLCIVALLALAVV
jgi:hypothetical protein